MPTYEYYCSNCNISFEDYKKVDERDNWRNCPQCDKIENVTRVIQATPTHFKSSGFYSTGG